MTDGKQMALVAEALLESEHASRFAGLRVQIARSMPELTQLGSAIAVNGLDECGDELRRI